MATRAGKKSSGPKTVVVPETITIRKGQKQEIEDPYEVPPKQDALEMLANAAEEMDRDLDKAIGKIDETQKVTVVELAEEMLAEKEEAERLEAEAKQHKDRYNEIRTRALPDLMRTLGLVDSRGKGSFTFAGGRVHLETRLSASCAVANKPGLFEWLRKNGAGDLVKPDVHQATLTAFVKERREQQLSDPPGVSIWEETKAKITKT